MMENTPRASGMLSKLINLSVQKKGGREERERERKRRGQKNSREPQINEQENVTEDLTSINVAHRRRRLMLFEGRREQRSAFP